MKSQLYLLPLVLFSTASCDRSTPTASAEQTARTAQLEAEVARLKADQAKKSPKELELEAELERLKANQRRNELTRESAAAALNPALATDPIKSIAFSSDGLKRAIQNGIVKFRNRNNFGNNYDFTEAGFRTFGPLIEKTPVMPMFGLHEFITPAEEGRDHSIQLKTPISERVSEVTGIAPTPFPGISTVEFVTDYVLPPELESVKQYFYTGRRDKRTFQKYDDGWRLMPKDRH